MALPQFRAQAADLLKQANNRALAAQVALALLSIVGKDQNVSILLAMSLPAVMKLICKSPEQRETHRDGPGRVLTVLRTSRRSTVALVVFRPTVQRA